MERELRTNIIRFPSPAIVDGNNALKTDNQSYWPFGSVNEQNLIDLEKHRRRGNSLAEIIDYFDFNWEAEGLPKDWHRLNKIGFRINGQMALLKGNDYGSKALWTTQTRMDLLGYIQECLRQGVVFPFWYDKFDGVDFVNTTYGKRMADIIDPKERGGAVTITAEKMRDFLKERESGAMAIMVSPAGETGLVDPDGNPINYEAFQVFTLRKVGEGLEGVTLRTDFNLEEAREFIEIYTGIKLSPDARIEAYMGAILIEPQKKETIEKVASNLMGIRERNQPQRADIAYDPKVDDVSPKTWQDMFLQLQSRDSIYDIDKPTTGYIDGFKEHVLSNDLSPLEIQKALAATLLRISRHFFIIEDYRKLSSVAKDDHLTENIRPDFTYGEAYDRAAERPTCVGVSNSSELDILLEPDQYGERTFRCPHCKRLNIRPKGKLLQNCQHCGKDVSCAPGKKKQESKKAA